MNHHGLGGQIVWRGLCVVFSTHLLIGCGPGVSDDTVQLGKSHYYLSSSGPRSHTLEERMRDGSIRDVVRRNIVYHAWEEPYLIAVRQIVNDYACSEGYAKSETLDELEYWVVDVLDGVVRGPLSFDAYEELVSRGVPGLGITASQLLDQKKPSRELENCTEPRSLN